MKVNNIIDQFAIEPSESNMKTLVNWARGSNVTDEDICYLANVLAGSGDNIPKIPGMTYVDIPSTGGPTSLSTIICPLLLKEYGYCIPKLGIVGRPAGGIDILNQISGYNIDYDVIDIIDILERDRYCHFIVGDAFAPLDNILFKYRSTNNAKALPALVIASILSKKIAAQLDLTGLDVRVGDFGNFGKTVNDAEVNSKRFISVAKLAGISAKCFISYYNSFQQPYIGRGEALIALNNIFEDQSEITLNNHLNDCVEMVRSLVNGKVELLGLKDILKKNFIQNIEIQGGSYKEFLNKVENVKRKHIWELNSQDDGYIDIDLNKVRNAIVLGQKEVEDQRFPDNCGIIFKVDPYQKVKKGELILTLRMEQGDIDNYMKNIIESISIKNEPNQLHNMKIIE